MTLTKRQVSKLNKIIGTVQDILNLAEKSASRAGPAPKAARFSGKQKRSRRSGAEAVKMRAEILAKRAKGVPVAKLAGKYGVSTAYIYMIK